MTKIINLLKLKLKYNFIYPFCSIWRQLGSFGAFLAWLWQPLPVVNRPRPQSKPQTGWSIPCPIPLAVRMRCGAVGVGTFCVGWQSLWRRGVVFFCTFYFPVNHFFQRRLQCLAENDWCGYTQLLRGVSNGKGNFLNVNK